MVKKFYFIDGNASNVKKNPTPEDKFLKNINKSLTLKPLMVGDQVYFRKADGTVSSGPVARISKSMSVSVVDNNEEVLLKAGQYFQDREGMEQRHTFYPEVAIGDVVRYGDGLAEVKEIRKGGNIVAADIRNQTDLALGPGEYGTDILKQPERIEKAKKNEKNEMKRFIAGGLKGDKKDKKKAVKHTITREPGITKRGERGEPMSEEKAKKLGDAGKLPGQAQVEVKKKGADGKFHGTGKYQDAFRQYMKIHVPMHEKKFGMGRSQAVAAALKEARKKGMYAGDEDLNGPHKETPGYQAGLDKMHQKSQDLDLTGPRKGTAAYESWLAKFRETLRKKGKMGGVDADSEPLFKEGKKDLDLVESKELQEYISHKIKKLMAEGKPQKQAEAIAISMARKKGFEYPKQTKEIKKSSETKGTQKFVGEQVKRHMKKYGMGQKQAVAAALAEAREKGRKVSPAPKKSEKSVTVSADFLKSQIDITKSHLLKAMAIESAKKEIVKAKKNEEKEGVGLPSMSPQNKKMADKKFPPSAMPPRVR